MHFEGNKMAKHIIKLEHSDGVKLPKPILWCNRPSDKVSWYFQDAQHVALAVGGSIQPCKSCIKAIIKQLEIEL